MNLGRARLVQKRSSFFPFRNAWYFDCTPWNGGFVRRTGAPGAVVIDETQGICVNLQTGQVYVHEALVPAG